MTYALFLDDIRTPAQVAEFIKSPTLRQKYESYPWYVARSYQEFVERILNAGVPTHVSLDHDLSERQYGKEMTHEEMAEYYQRKNREMTGYDALKWLIAHCKTKNAKIPFCYIHTMNPVGKENMMELIKSYQ